MRNRWRCLVGAAAAAMLGACGGEETAPPPPPLALGLVSTVAGATGGAGAVDAAGAAARFREPRGVVRSGQALYVVDAGNAAVRKVDLATGRVTTLAGGGEPGQAPADGVGTAARFSRLTGAIASDGASLYLGDSGAVRRVDLGTGAVDTFAGRVAEPGFADGAGDGARFLDPGGIATDGASLWVADTGNQAIREVVLATREVRTLAGVPGPCAAVDGIGSAARFCRPTGIAAAGALLFVADSGNHAIRRVEKAGGAVTAFAGSPGQAGLADGVGATARLEAPAGLASDGATLYVAQRTTVRAVSLSSGEVTTLAGSGWVSGGRDGTGPAAQLGEVVGLASDAGVVYLADAASHAVRALDPATRTVTTLSGSPLRHLPYDGPLFDGPSGIARGSGRSVYVADTGNHVVRKVELDQVSWTWRVTTVAGVPRTPGAQDGPGSSAGFDSPEGVAVGESAVWVADTGNHAIRKIDLASGEVTTVAGSAGEAGSADGPGAAARFRSPGALSLGTGALYVADTGNHAVRKLDLLSGEVTTVAGSAGEAGAQDGVGGAARFSGPEGLVAVGGVLYVSDTWNATIRRVDLATGEVTTLAGSPGEHGDLDGFGSAARLDLPTGIDATTGGGSTTLWVADAANGLKVRRIHVDTGEVRDHDRSSYGWYIPTRYQPGKRIALRARGLAALVWGEYLVADPGGHTLRYVNPLNTRSTVAGTETAAGHADGTGYTVPFGSPGGIACDGESLWVADRDNTWVRKVSTSTGGVTTVASIAQGLWRPAGVALAGGRLYAADEEGRQILLLGGPGAQAVPLAGIAGWDGYEDGPGDVAAFASPWGMASDGTFLYVADTRNSAIRRVSLATGMVSTLAGGPGSPDLFLPAGLATDGTTVWVSDSGRAVIRSVSLATGAVATLAGALDLPGAADGRGEAARFDAPMGLALHGRTLYVADARNRAVRAVDVDTGDATTVAGSTLAAGMVDGAIPEASFAAPVGVCVTGSGLAVLDSPGFARWPVPPPPNADAAVRLLH